MSKRKNFIDIKGDNSCKKRKDDETINIFSGHLNKQESEDEQNEQIALLPKAASKKIKEVVNTNNFGANDFTQQLKSKDDVTQCPLWVTPNGHIFLEAFSPICQHAQDFLIAIAEPVSRPEFIHEYKMTAYSLYAAVSVGFDTNHIIESLTRLCKTSIPDSVLSFIESCTLSYGKVMLVLKYNCYYLETKFKDVYNKLMTDSILSSCFVMEQTKHPPPSDRVDDKAMYEDDLLNVEDDSIYSLHVRQDKIELVQKRCNELEYPLLSEYDYKNDSTIPNTPIRLKPSTILRPYQEKSLRKTFCNGRARSGLIVLPCGAGKSLVGVTAACTVRKRCIILCTSNVSVEQWRSQFRLWTDISDKHIFKFTSSTKQQPDDKHFVCISTYNMISHTKNRSFESELVMQWVKEREWGLLILDEVHTIPARIFRQVLTILRVHCKIGLTATLVREDDKITDLNFLIGPKLYEANWLDLQKSGYIARVKCAEVWCPMTPEFFQEYINSSKQAKKMLLYVMNPNKFRACQFLIDYHEKRNDKIIVFSDSIVALMHYAVKLKKHFLYGPTSQEERLSILHRFQTSPTVNTIFVSKVADTSFDLPDANVLIQISSHGGSRRQEAQRLGRILRPKKGIVGDEYNAFFYSLISQDTTESKYAAKRHAFLVNQGYCYNVIKTLPGLDDAPLFYSTKAEQAVLLQEVLKQCEKGVLEEEIEELKKSETTTVGNRSMSMLSGGHGLVYADTTKRASPAKRVHHLFKKYKR